MTAFTMLKKIIGAAGVTLKWTFLAMVAILAVFFKLLSLFLPTPHEDDTPSDEAVMAREFNDKPINFVK